MKAKITALALMGALAVVGCGADEESAQSGTPGNGTDRAFVAAMIPPHESAVKMAGIAQGLGERQATRGGHHRVANRRDHGDAQGRRRACRGRHQPGKLSVSEHMTMDEDPGTLRNAKPAMTTGLGAQGLDGPT